MTARHLVPRGEDSQPQNGNHDRRTAMFVETMSWLHRDSPWSRWDAVLVRQLQLNAEIAVRNALFEAQMAVVEVAGMRGRSHLSLVGRPRVSIEELNQRSERARRTVLLLSQWPGMPDPLARSISVLSCEWQSQWPDQAGDCERMRLRICVESNLRVEGDARHAPHKLSLPTWASDDETVELLVSRRAGLDHSADLTAGAIPLLYPDDVGDVRYAAIHDILCLPLAES